jgi:hypothetical protein
VESVGVTVTEEPETVTFRKWKSWLLDVGSGAMPHLVPLALVSDQPIA